MLVKVNPLRFREEVREILDRPVVSGKILLYGSSFFTVWGHERSVQQMDGAVVNNGFGGATGEDLLYYYQELVRPYAPKSLILRTGVNDISSGYSAKQAAHFAIRVAEWAAFDFEGIRVGILPSFDCPWLDKNPKKKREAHKAFNERMAEYAEAHDNVEFLDIRPFFYKDGKKEDGFLDIFTPDGLHLLDCGYELFAPYFRQMLEKKGFLTD